MGYTFVKGMTPAERLPKFLGSVGQLTNVVCALDWLDRRARMVGIYTGEE